MRDVDAYVDKLFSKYKNNDEIIDLKEEIAGNLKARIEDSMAQGLTYEKAYKEAVKDLGRVEDYIPGSKRIYINAYKKEMLQISILYILILWIITIPLRLSYSLMMINISLAIILIILGLLSLVVYSRKDKKFYEETSSINTLKIYKIKKFTWLIWWFFIIITTGFNFSVRFASNIWFSRPIRIQGPYQFAVLASSFLLPFLTLVIPLIVSKAYKIIQNHEVK